MSNNPSFASLSIWAISCTSFSSSKSSDPRLFSCLISARAASTARHEIYWACKSKYSSYLWILKLTELFSFFSAIWDVRMVVNCSAVGVSIAPIGFTFKLLNCALRSSYWCNWWKRGSTSFFKNWIIFTHCNAIHFIIYPIYCKEKVEYHEEKLFISTMTAGLPSGVKFSVLLYIVWLNQVFKVSSR